MENISAETLLAQRAFKNALIKTSRNIDKLKIGDKVMFYNEGSGQLKKEPMTIEQVVNEERFRLQGLDREVGSAMIISLEYLPENFIELYEHLNDGKLN